MSQKSCRAIPSILVIFSICFGGRYVNLDWISIIILCPGFIPHMFAFLCHGDLSLGFGKQRLEMLEIGNG
jgi:hypothetical protein